MKVGILGGGQLGLMLAQAAAQLGLECVGLSPQESPPLSKVTKVLQEDYHDKSALMKRPLPLQVDAPPLGRSRAPTSLPLE